MKATFIETFKDCDKVTLSNFMSIGVLRHVVPSVGFRCDCHKVDRSNFVSEIQHLDIILLEC